MNIVEFWHLCLHKTHPTRSYLYYSLEEVYNQNAKEKLLWKQTKYAYYVNEICSVYTKKNENNILYYSLWQFAYNL